MNIKSIVLILIVIAIGTSSCREKPKPVNPTIYGSAMVSIDNKVGNKDLSLSDTWFITDAGDSIRIKKYAYYISNIKLATTEDGVYVEDNSYHLVDEDKQQSKIFTLNKIPVGTYTSISFLIGVDSLRNVSGAQTGDLDPAHGMFWDWNTGYIMAKLEGESPQSTVSNNIVTYHLGGFKGPYKVQRMITIQFPQPMVVKESGKSEIHMANNLLEWFKTPTTVRFSNMPVIKKEQDNTTLADNYADMFSVEHID